MKIHMITIVFANNKMLLSLQFCNKAFGTRCDLLVTTKKK